MKAERNPARDRARRTLSHYLQTIGEAAGVRLDGAHATEIDAIVDDIIDAAVVEMQACRTAPAATGACTTCGGAIVNTGGPEDVCVDCGRTIGDQELHQEARQRRARR